MSNDENEMNTNPQDNTLISDSVQENEVSPQQLISNEIHPSDISNSDGEIDWKHTTILIYQGPSDVLLVPMAVYQGGHFSYDPVFHSEFQQLMEKGHIFTKEHKDVT